MESKLVTATHDGGDGLILFVTLNVMTTHFLLCSLWFCWSLTWPLQIVVGFSLLSHIYMNLLKQLNCGCGT